MKRLFAVLLSLMLLTAPCLNALAEQADAPPTLPDGGAFPEMPEGFGDFNFGDFGDFDGSFGGSFGGGFPGGSGEKAEGQLGSWGDGGKKRTRWKETITLMMPLCT